MGSLDGRVALVTGAGRGMGREHALLFAAHGARVVVNDTGAERDGSGGDPSVAASVVEEIMGAGGTAVASADDVATMDGAQHAVELATETFGRLDVLINNAGVLRDRMFVNMTEEEWDDVIRGHLRSHFCATRVAAGLWRDRTKAGESVDAAVVNVSSTSGLRGAVGQSNYGAAKAGIAALTVILAEELARYGVRVNAIVPVARTRMTEEVAGIADLVRVPADPAAFDVFHPGNVSPLVAWLASAPCPLTGRVFLVRGGEVRLFEGWRDDRAVVRDERWSVEGVGEAATSLVAGADAGQT
jgi:NAD(P)-dependent dehydrogenase (short-subunit alcohol dehydrogenase family)